MTLPRAFANSNYTCLVGSEDTSTAATDIRTFACISRTTTTFTKGITGGTFDFSYVAFGYWK